MSTKTKPAAGLAPRAGRSTADAGDRITPRDLFAAAALTGILAWTHEDDVRDVGPIFAAIAFGFADDMMRKRGGR